MKNIISNILGVLIIGLAVYRVAFNELPIVAASFLTGIGAILFYSLVAGNTAINSPFLYFNF